MTSSPYFQPSSTPQVSNWVQAGRRISANLPVGVRKLSWTTRHSTRFSSRENARRPVDVGVLVDEAVAGHGPDELDVRIETIGAHDAVVGAHALAPDDGLRPEEARDRGLDGIVARGKDDPRRPAVRRLEGDASRPAAGDADVAGDRRQDAAGPDHLLAVSPPLHPVSLVEDRRLGRRVFAADAGDRRPRDPGDRLGPIRRLGDPVAPPEDVVLVAFVGLASRGHPGRVEPDAVRPDEVPVDEAFGDHDVGHGRHHGRVRPGADGHPLVGERHGAHRHARVDADRAGAALPGQPDEIFAVRPVAHLGRIPAPHQEVFGVEPILPLVPGDRRPVDGRRRGRNAGPGIAVVEAERAPDAIEEPLGGLAPGQLAVAARPVGHEEGGIAVSLSDPEDLPGDAVGGLVPRDPLETPRPSGADAFHGIFQPVGVILTVPVGPAPDTGPELGIGDRVGRTVVAFDAGDDTVPDKDPEHAAAAAVVRRTAGPDHALPGARGRRPPPVLRAGRHRPGRTKAAPPVRAPQRRNPRRLTGSVSIFFIPSVPGSDRPHCINPRGRVKAGPGLYLRP